MGSLRAAVDAGHELVLVLQAPERDLPPEDSKQRFDVHREPSAARLEEVILEFEPDIAIVAGWHVGAYRVAAQLLRGRALRILAFDAQWHGTLKQLAGRVAFRTHLRSLYDVALIPGTRQATFARKMGFSPERIYYGSIPANDGRFRADEGTSRTPGFLSVSRLAPEKEIHLLLHAYKTYRQSVADPWPLRIVGTGPVTIPRTDGVTALGHQPPGTVADEMHRATCFVLASSYEPWGVVFHEAALSGLPIIATDDCGAVGSFVLNGQNAWVVRSRDSTALTNALRLATLSSEHQLANMSRASVTIAARSTRSTWVAVLELIARSHREDPLLVARSQASLGQLRPSASPVPTEG
jgi:glycosyltransferase involved in cell wall biosynthesis